MPLDSPLVQRARSLAHVAHEGQVRKAAGEPYVSHLEAVARLLAEHGNVDDVVLAAAYLHDLLEDRPQFEAAMRSAMPAEVVAIVEVLTERKTDADGRPRAKRARFDDYVAALRTDTVAAVQARAISCADKIHNAYSLAEHSAILGKLNTRPGEHRLQLATLRDVYAPTVDASLLASFDRAAAALAASIAAWLPGWAVAIAAEAHLGQFDKGGAPYIDHPLRLMLRARTPAERMVAVLHDVVEDSRWTLDALAREGFPPEVLRAIEHLTRREHESYDAFIDRVAEDRLATRVKLLDLADNADLSRIPAPTDADRQRLETYHRATARLEATLPQSLYVQLDADSTAAVRHLARHPVVRGDHVTLAHAIELADTDRVAAHVLPPGHAIGDAVEVVVLGEASDERVQALAVEVAGRSRDPIEDRVLHVTVSRSHEARSVESNDLLVRAELTTLTMHLRGTLRWVRT